ncbi:MAG: hypothetical protein APR54_01905 [Candidatus Cloacimonas sp. SDB]|nr:MAG: hypothetical protein APR54_01905 [Candidatus Cloacimonas sp. SDB]
MTPFLRILCLLTILIPASLSAQEKISLKPKLAAYPQLSYTENTDFIFGLRFFYMYYPQEIFNPDFQNKMQLVTIYTQRKQFELYFEPEFNLLQGKLKIHSKLKFQLWPSEFYGIGKNSLQKSETYTRKTRSLELDIIREVTDGIYFGLLADFDHTDISDLKANCMLLNCNIPGAYNYDIAGLGFTIINDKRDSRTYATRGYSQQFRFIHYNRFMGSDFQFTKSSLDLRFFTNLNYNHVFAFQTLFQTTHDKAPFLELAELGDEMRSFDSALYIDNHLLFSRIEYRTFPLQPEFLNRFGFVLFLEAGKVTGSLAEFDFQNIRICYGTGIRFAVFPYERSNLRFDLGFSKEKMGINISFGEAF